MIKRLKKQTYITLLGITMLGGVVLTAKEVRAEENLRFDSTPDEVTAEVAGEATPEVAGITYNITQARLYAVGCAFEPHGEDLDPSGFSTISPEEAYERMIAMEDAYPTGTSWTNANSYAWSCGWSAAGCMGFAHMISDAAFGNAAFRTIENDGSGNMYDKIKVGDVVRTDYNSHSVIVLEKNSDHIVVAEGNWSGQVLWGRTISKDKINSDCAYIETRYGR